MASVALRLAPALLLAAVLPGWAPAPAAAQAQDPAEGYIDWLDSKSPKAREAAIMLMQESKTRSPAVITRLFRVLSDPNEVPTVQRAALDALKALTGRDFPTHKKWMEWWDTEGVKEFGNLEPLSPRVGQLEEAIRRVEKSHVQLQKDVDNAKILFQIIFMASLVLGILFIVVMIAFGVMGGSRLKAMRETIRQAERYITAGEEVHKRFDGIVNELEAKKTEILDFFRKLKEEHQAEIERYAELLQQNTEHRMREEAMGLRQKGEKELLETLQQLKGSMHDELQRQAAEQKASVGAEIRSQEARFLQEVEAHTLLLEGAIAAGHGKHEHAMNLFKRVLALKPQNAAAWTHLGASLRQLGRFEEAHEALRKAFEIAPAHPHALYQAAAAYALQRRRDRMLETLEKAFQNDGEFKDEALNDPAFRDYWQDPAFKDLAEG